MADSSYDIHVRTTREGDAARQEAAQLENLTASTDAAAAATKRLAQANGEAAAASREKQAALATEPRIIDVSSGPGPGGFINTKGELEQVDRTAREASEAVQLTIGSLNTASAAAAATAQNVRAYRESIAVTTAAKLEDVAASEGVTSAELEAYAARVRATQAAEAEAAATEAAAAAKVEDAAASDAMAISTRGLGAGVSRLGSQLFGLGGLGRSIFNPMILSVIVLVDLYARARRELEEWNRELDKEGEKAAEPEFRKAFEARAEAITKARLEAEAYADKLAHIVDSERRIMEMYERQIALERDRASAAREAGDAQAGAEAARLRNLHQEGVVSTEQYYLRLEELQRRHIAEQLRIEREADEREVDLKRAQLERAQGRVPTADAAEAARRTQSDQATRRVGEDEKLLEEQRKKRDEEEKTVAAFRTEVETKYSKYGSRDPVGDLKRFVDLLDRRDKGEDVSRFHFFLDSMEEKFSAAQARIDLQALTTKETTLQTVRDEIAKLEARLPGERSTAGQAQANLDRAMRAAEEARSQSQKLQDELDDLRAKLGIKEGASKSAAKSRTEEAASQAVGEIEKSSPQSQREVSALRAAAVAIQNAGLGGKPVSPEERDLITRIASLAQGKQVSYADAVKYVQDLARSDDALLTVLKSITDRRSTLALTPGSAGPEFDKQLSQVTSRLVALLAPDVAAAGKGLMPTRTGAVAPRPETFDFNAPGHEAIRDAAELYRTHLKEYHDANVAGHRANAETLKKMKAALDAELAKIREEIADAKLH